MKDLDLLAIGSWFGILVVAVQYYISNFLKPAKWEQSEKEVDPIKREKLRKRFMRKWDLIIFPLLCTATALGLIGIILDW